jgi:hypothetical protein
LFLKRLSKKKNPLIIKDYSYCEVKKNNCNRDATFLLFIFMQTENQPTLPSNEANEVAMAELYILCEEVQRRLGGLFHALNKRNVWHTREAQATAGAEDQEGSECLLEKLDQILEAFFMLY